MSASLLVHDVHLLDEEGGFGSRCDVAVEDGRVTAVGPALRAPAGAEVLDLGGRWLIPGVFDCHAHVTSTTLDGFEAMSTPVTRWTLEATRNARLMLEAGVTTLRDASGADAGLRDAGEDELFLGPEMQVSCVMLTETGGHGDGFLPGPGLEMTPDYYVPDFPDRVPHLVDGVDGMRAAVRAVARAGADWVKLAATGGAGVLAPNERPDVPELTREELAVAVGEGRRKGIPVMSHAMGGVGLDDSVAAGVRSIEHGWFLTEEQAAAMARAGCWLVPTLAIGRELVAWAEAGRFPGAVAERARALEGRLGENVRIAREHGVPLALGTDFITREQHGRNLVEITYMCEAGLSLGEALLAATRGGAELCGRGGSHGRLAPGFVFDAVVLGSEPKALAFADRALVTAVFKRGQLVKNAM